jgi:hypothetical protein
MAEEQKRYIKLPRTPKGVPGFNMADWAIWYADTEPRLSENHSRARVQRRIVEAFEGLKPPSDEHPGDVAEVRDSDWQLVLGWITDEKDPPKCGLAPALVMEAPDGSQRTSPMPARHVLDYIDAWRDATTTKPEAPKAPEAAPAEAPATVAAAE